MFDRNKFNKLKDMAKEKAEESAQMAKEKVGESDLKAKAEDSALRARGKAKGLFEKPRTRSEETRFKKKTYFYCSTCDAEIGPTEESKAKAAMGKLFGETKAAFTLISVKKEPTTATGADLAKVALGNKTDMSFKEMFKSDVVQDHKSKTLLIQCDYCGKYHCSSCWNLEKNTCKNCENLSLRDVL